MSFSSKNIYFNKRHTGRTVGGSIIEVFLSAGRILPGYARKLRVIKWASKKLSDAEKKPGITELEFLAVAWSIKHFDNYLRGRKIKKTTDHTALKAIKSKHIFGSLKLERMREDLQEYDFEVEYRKGSELIDADAISRIYEEPEKRKPKREKQECFNRKRWKVVLQDF